ncbi:hypothetical protein B0H19DRAFT_1058986 [Mycena capillaripes]|nr:hypothetical protein B0H19DRAFT_1058986 [Mycena capillaripes]
MTHKFLQLHRHSTERLQELGQKFSIVLQTASPKKETKWEGWWVPRGDFDRLEVFGLSELLDQPLICHMANGSILTIPTWLMRIDSRDGAKRHSTPSGSTQPRSPASMPSQPPMAVHLQHPHKRAPAEFSRCPGPGALATACHFVFVVPSTEVGERLRMRSRAPSRPHTSRHNVNCRGK